MLFLIEREPPQAVFHDDDGPVHDQAEVDRAEAHKIARHLRLDHPGDGHQHRQRDHQRGDQGRPPVAEQQEQHHDHQQGPFQQIISDGVYGLVHQRRAVIDGIELYPGRQRRLDLFQFRSRGPRHLAAVFADQHKHRAEHDFPAILGRGAGAQFAAGPDLGQVAYL